MQRPDEILDSRAHQNGAQPLPLFRPEALLHQQQKSYGEIILIRPLSLTLLTCLALVIIALAGAFLLLGRYTEKGRVSGALLASPGGASSLNDAQLRAELYVPARWLVAVQPGTRLSLRCRACSPQFAEQPATVEKISAVPSATDGNSANTKSFEPSYKVTVSLPPQPAQLAGFNRSPQAGMPVEADVPLGRKSLINWLFKPSGS
jgi:hypothetical protein